MFVTLPWYYFFKVECCHLNINLLFTEETALVVYTVQPLCVRVCVCMQISPQGNKVFHLFSGTVSLLSPPAGCFSLTLSFSLSLLFSLCDSYCLALCPALPLKQSKWVVSWMNERRGAEWQRDNLEHLREGMNEQVDLTTHFTFHVFSLYWFFLLHLFLVSCLKISRFANKSMKNNQSKESNYIWNPSLGTVAFPPIFGQFALESKAKDFFLGSWKCFTSQWRGCFF